MKRRKNPIRFREAWQGMAALMKNPDDTGQVFKIIRALAGNAGERQFQRFRASEHGPTILAENRSLADRLSDRTYLASLPAGSLGRVYADFTDREQISPAGLIEASESVPNDGQPVDRERMLFGARQPRRILRSTVSIADHDSMFGRDPPCPQVGHEHDESDTAIPGLTIRKCEQCGFADQISPIAGHDMPEIVAVAHPSAE